MSGGGAAAELVGVTFAYERHRSVLADTSLEFRAGLLTRLQGPNGSGKSTLLELLAGSAIPQAGTIRVLGTDARDPALRGRRAVARTGVGLFPELTVAEHVALASGWRRIGRHAIEERLARYGVGPWMHERIAALSTGNARRATFVLSTLGEPELFVLDEPFNGLDDQAVGEVVADLRRWRRDGATVVLVAHAPPPDVESLIEARLELEPGRADGQAS
jgi:ABC-type multidrug transport system ATPase subunit